MSELVELLKQALRNESGYEFEPRNIVDEKTQNSYKKLLRKYDVDSLPKVLRLYQKGELFDYYDIYESHSHYEIEDWENDWKDDNPIFIDYVELWPEKAIIGTLGEFPLLLMLDLYYDGVEIMLEPLDSIYVDRESRMEFARYVPALIKDIEVALKIMREASAKYGFEASEFKLFNSRPFINRADFSLKSEFLVTNMDDQEIVENCIKRAKVMSEWRRKFREWLPSLERKKFYENTKTCHETRMLERGYEWITKIGGLIKWPVKDKKVREELVRHHIYRYLDHGAPLFTLDGYAIIGYRIDHEYKFKFWVDRKERKFKRLSPIPLEKMEFLKEDFPEMFK